MSELTPVEKGRRTKLINEAIQAKQDLEAAEARLETLKAEIWAFAESDLLEGDVKSLVFPTAAGVCEVGMATTITLPKGSEANLRAILGDRSDELLEVTQKVSITDGLRRLLTEPQPMEQSLAERLRGCVQFKRSSRFTFKPAA